MKTPSKKLRAVLLVALTLGMVALAVWAPIDTWTEILTEEHRWRGPKGVVLFVVAYVMWNFVLPPAPLQFLAGMYYGVGGGMAVILIGTTLANVVSHSVARGLGRAWVAARVEESARLHRLEQTIDYMGWRAVALLRLSNLVPSNLANLVMGITTLRLGTILWASILGSLPGWVFMVVVGRGGGALLTAESLTPTQWAGYIASAVLALGCLVILGRRAHQKLEEIGDRTDE